VGTPIGPDIPTRGHVQAQQFSREESGHQFTLSDERMRRGALVALSGHYDHDGMGEAAAGMRVGDRSRVETLSGSRGDWLDRAEPHMSTRQNAREADGIRSSWQTNGQDL
jgi:hypothetical protein